ncbi:protein kinase domain-containing protein [Acinetobacter kyonggiensis]|uniref:Protein kinase domain-containing protein n=1 Tax=Acinetobacter kyonggiensis TaxID=595670 RepID=A0A1H3KHA9_9GAMM|nr:protein kinase [Acinetobacter kyonggiensis]SDY50998.1 Protein kinase domain-containing protein [Acinetobacter kyonggiensis]
MTTITDFLHKNGYRITESSPNGYINGYIAEKENSTYFIKHINDRRRNKKTIKDILIEVSKLNHSNILKIHDILTLDQNNIFCIYTHINALTLNKYIKSKYYNTYDKKYEKLKVIFMRIAKAIDYLHKNKIVHADIIGANILIDQNNSPIIIDFDFALKTTKKLSLEKSIDILSFKVMVFQIIFEQIFIGSKYKDYLEKDILQKHTFIIPRIKKCQKKYFSTCEEFIKYLF